MTSRFDEVYLGIDLGSVSAKMVVLRSSDLKIMDSLYIRTHGDPLGALRILMQRLVQSRPHVRAAATTGSGRHLAARLINTQIAKNEITTHTLAAVKITPDVRTIVEIGGQDSKIIIVKNQRAVDFAMNTVCAAGTGSFLDQQSNRLGIQVEDMGKLSLSSDHPAAISGRCTVFAETDMIHKQQLGIPVKDIVAGLCRSLVRNYLATVAKGKPIRPQVVFQGGVAANQAIVKELGRQTGHDIVVSPYYGTAGAYGAALLSSMSQDEPEEFFGYQMLERTFRINSFVCRDCEEFCDVLRLYKDGKPVSYWNDRCGRFSEPGLKPSSIPQ